MAQCKHCQGSPEVGNYFAHLWIVHPDIAKKELDHTKEVNKSPMSHNKIMAPTSVQDGGRVVAVVEKKPAATVFMLGSERIEIDPKDLYETYLLYLDIKAKTKMDDSFSVMFKDAMGICWRLMVAKPVIKTTMTVEVGHNGSNGRHDNDQSAEQ